MKENQNCRPLSLLKGYFTSDEACELANISLTAIKKQNLPRVDLGRKLLWEEIPFVCHFFYRLDKKYQQFYLDNLENNIRIRTKAHFGEKTVREVKKCRQTAKRY